MNEELQTLSEAGWRQEFEGMLGCIFEKEEDEEENERTNKRRQSITHCAVVRCSNPPNGTLMGARSLLDVYEELSLPLDDPSTDYGAKGDYVLCRPHSDAYLFRYVVETNPRFKKMSLDNVREYLSRWCAEKRTSQ